MENFLRFNSFWEIVINFKIKNLSYLSTYYSTEKNFKDFNKITHNLDLENFSKKKSTYLILIIKKLILVENFYKQKVLRNLAMFVLHQEIVPI